MSTVLEWGNPFTHEEHKRITYSKSDARYQERQGRCNWCGQVRRRLYAYDGHEGLFCNRTCFRDYYGY
jgi:hypothetical protein